MDPAWIYDIVGGLGAAQIVSAYIALQLGKIDPRSILFSATNAVGAGAILVSLIDDFNLGAFVVEAFWLAVSLFGIVRALRHPASASPETFE